MNTPPDSIQTGYMAKLQTMTASSFSQVVFYLVLVVVFFAIDQLVVADLYRHPLSYPWSIFYWLLGLGGWIPGLANLMVIAVAARARPLLAYSIAVAGLTYFLAIAYYFLSGLYLTSTDAMDGPVYPIIWLIYWFLGGVVGLIIRLMVRKLT